MTDTTSPATGTPRTVLITGTSSGIGLATAIAAAQAGWSVIATMRDLERGAALREAASAADVSLDVRELDVTDDDSVTAAVENVVHDYGRLDAVVNNAGSALVGTVEILGLDAFRAAMEVNFFGVVRMTRAAMPHLRASGGRVVTISSVGGVVGQPFNEAYCAAKFAVEGFLESLHPVARTVGVGVVIIEPGVVVSRFVANAGVDREAALEGAGVYGPALGTYLERTAAAFAAAQSADGVADIVLRSLESPNPAFRVQTSDGATAFVGVKLADLDGSRVTGLTAGWVGA